MLPSPTPAPVASQAPVRSDPCGGYQELLKKYLSASPCVFVAGQAAVQMTYSGTNVPEVLTHTADGKTTTFTISSQAFGYPGALLHVGVSPSSQVTIVLAILFANQLNAERLGVRDRRHRVPLQTACVYQSEGRRLGRRARLLSGADGIARTHGGRPLVRNQSAAQYRLKPGALDRRELLIPRHERDLAAAGWLADLELLAASRDVLALSGRDAAGNRRAVWVFDQQALSDAE